MQVSTYEDTIQDAMGIALLMKTCFVDEYLAELELPGSLPADAIGGFHVLAGYHPQLHHGDLNASALPQLLRRARSD